MTGESPRESPIHCPVCFDVVEHLSRAPRAGLGPACFDCVILGENIWCVFDALGRLAMREDIAALVKTISADFINVVRIEKNDPMRILRAAERHGLALGRLRAIAERNL